MRIIIVDDDGIIRDSLSLIIGMEEDMEVVAVCSNGEDGFKKSMELNPDIVLMDVRMPIMDGISATKLIKESIKDIDILVLTTFKDDEYIKECLKYGASGYVLKNQRAESIIESIRTIYNGNMVLDKALVDDIPNIFKKDKTFICKDDLCEREMEILRLIGNGFNNKEISGKLYLSEGTIRNYVTKLLEKLDMRDRTQLAIYYVKNYEI